MKIKYPWIIFHFGVHGISSTLECSRCNTEFEIETVSSVEEKVLLLNAFVKEHKGCKNEN